MKITSGGKPYNLTNSAKGTCAANWGPYFVVIGGSGWYWVGGSGFMALGVWLYGVHGKVHWWEI